MHTEMRHIRNVNDRSHTEARPLCSVMSVRIFTEYEWSQLRACYWDDMWVPFCALSAFAAAIALATARLCATSQWISKENEEIRKWLSHQSTARNDARPLISYNQNGQMDAYEYGSNSDDEHEPNMLQICQGDTDE